MEWMEGNFCCIDFPAVSMKRDKCYLDSTNLNLKDVLSFTFKEA